jgi:hypothetical protein
MRAVNLKRICCLAMMLVFFQAGKAFSADSTAAFSSSFVLWGTRVTRLLVAGSWRSIHLVALDGTNSLLMKFAVSMGFAIFWWLVGYSVAVELAEVVAGVNLPAVACKPRVAVREGAAALREAMLAMGVDVVRMDRD